MTALFSGILRDPEIGFFQVCSFKKLSKGVFVQTAEEASVSLSLKFSVFKRAVQNASRLESIFQQRKDLLQFIFCTVQKGSAGPDAVVGVFGIQFFKKHLSGIDSCLAAKTDHFF